MLVTVDTSALVAVLNQRDEHHARAYKEYYKLKERQDMLQLPTIVLVELIGHITRNCTTGDERLRQLERFQRLPWNRIPQSDIDMELAVSFWKKYADWPVDLPDALVVATAKRTSSIGVWTYDNQLCRFAQHEIPGVALIGSGWES